MVKLILTAVPTLLSLAGGIILLTGNKKLPGKMFIVIGIELCACVVAIVALEGVLENIAALFLYVVTAVTALIFAIRIKVKFRIVFPKAVKRILIIVPAVIVILAGAGYGLRFTQLYAGMAENIKPVTGKDGISRLLYINCFYKDRIPGYTYSELLDVKYYSKATNTERRAKVVLPENYDENKKYPVIYLLHGLGGSDATWLHKDVFYDVFGVHHNPVWQNGLYNFMIDIRDNMN